MFAIKKVNEMRKDFKEVIKGASMEDEYQEQRKNRIRKQEAEERAYLKKKLNEERLKKEVNKFKEPFTQLVAGNISKNVRKAHSKKRQSPFLRDQQTAFTKGTRKTYKRMKM